MEIIQYVVSAFLGLWSLYYLIQRFRPKYNPATDKGCGGGCNC